MMALVATLPLMDMACQEMGAPRSNYPNPSHTCPKGSTYTEQWMKRSDYDGQPGPGILYYNGLVRIASCSGVLHVGVNTTGGGTQ